ncbi:MAG: hypothetical protein JWQ97_853 [Phenylobacterium sp.]|nr:hypothetical protein [Phenylobacterium sp.]
MSNEPFYRLDGERFLPNPIARGPWSESSLHGRAVIGLLGAELERRHGDPDFMPVRLTVDLYKLPDLSPVEVVTRVLRDGRRIRVAEADFVSNGVSCAHAIAQFLRKGETPSGVVWKPGPWDAPKPAEVPDAHDRRSTVGGMWAIKPINGFEHAGPRRAWMSEVREMVAGRPHTAFSRVAAAADYASPFSHAGPKGLDYINTDMTVYLHRTPVTEWVGFETVNHGATAGVAVGETFLHDEDGPIGFAACAALANPMPRRRREPDAG